VYLFYTYATAFIINAVFHLVGTYYLSSIVQTQDYISIFIFMASIFLILVAIIYLILEKAEEEFNQSIQTNMEDDQEQQANVDNSTENDPSGSSEDE